MTEYDKDYSILEIILIELGILFHYRKYPRKTEAIIAGGRTPHTAARS